MKQFISSFLTHLSMKVGLGLVVICLMVTALPAFGQVITTTFHAQPLLLQKATEEPEQSVSVIVQKTVKDDTVEQTVRGLGGTVTRDLHIINSFSAEIPAKQVPFLSTNSGVKWISMDALVNNTAIPVCANCINSDNLNNNYPKAVKAQVVWNNAPYVHGEGIGVAVVDSGINDGLPDIKGRVVTSYKTNSNTNNASDTYGHGTHVAGIIAGNGTSSNGAKIGIAPKANLINVKISDDKGMSSSSDLIAGLQWINDHKTAYNIRVVNISLNSGVAESYHTSPIDAAAEILWFNGIVVVVSAGNNGTNGTLYPPANDPFVITVGAVDDRNTPGVGDDVLTSFSAYGKDELGHVKPDLVAPGFNISSLLASPHDTLNTLHPSAKDPTNSNYFIMSGTSMSAPVVSGSVALLLQSNPKLNPDQVKYRLKSTAIHDLKTLPSYNVTTMGAGTLDLSAAINSTSTAMANTGQPASKLLWGGSTPVTWSSVNWSSVNWSSVNWSSVNWSSVNWSSVNWSSTFWGP